MNKLAEELIILHDILGPGKTGLRTFACAIREAERLLFSEWVPMDDIRVTKDIYPAVTRQMKKDYRSVARQIERLGNQCWHCMDDAQKEKYVGKKIKDIRGPRDMIFYLAFYVHFHQSYYAILEKQPSILFGKPTETG